MTSAPPVDKRASVEAVLVDDMDFEGAVPAGAFEFYDGPGPDAGILFGCPCGCGEMKTVSFRNHSDRRPLWRWDGNREKPTLGPSINILQFDETGNCVGEHWHGWLRDGVFQSC